MCNCNKVQDLWIYVKSLDLGKQANMSNENIIFNDVQNNPKVVMNTIVLITKRYIYRCRCLNEKLNVNVLKAFIREFKCIEFEIAKNKEKVSLHEQKWELVQV